MNISVLQQSLKMSAYDFICFISELYLEETYILYLAPVYKPVADLSIYCVLKAFSDSLSSVTTKSVCARAV